MTGEDPELGVLEILPGAGEVGDKQRDGEADPRHVGPIAIPQPRTVDSPTLNAR
jgi:hypothetical protein